MTYLSSTLFINRLYQQQYGNKIALAEEQSFIDKATKGVSDYISSKFTSEKLSENLFGTIMDFMGPGLLAGLGFPWIAVIYEVVGALGVDWSGIWKSLGNSAIEIAKSATKGEKLTEQEVYNKVEKATESAFQEHTTDNIDEQKLQEIAEKHSKEIGLATESNNYFDQSIIKESGIFSFMGRKALGGSARAARGTISGIFKKVIPWLITRALISLGIVAGVGAATGIVGIKPSDKKETEKNIQKPESEEPDIKQREPIHSYEISYTVNPNLFEFHRNDPGMIWLENGNINNIKSILSGWIFSAYPQLLNEKENIINSSSFIQVENMFRNRNKMAETLQIYSVPKPFQRKIDIVAYITNSYLKTRGK